MLEHTLGPDCWCRPEPCEDFLVHRHLVLTYDPEPRATLRLADGIPV
jgi:hypothetical protein